jgi:hypothetical protein
MPLMQVTLQTLAEESKHLESDAVRDADFLRQNQMALADAFDRDLEQREPPLDPQWVREATAVYVAAREALLQHEFNRRQARATRRDNLAAAGRAQARAMQLLAMQDRNVRSLLGTDGWKLLGTWGEVTQAGGQR